ncbi:MAG: benzoate/H(+) symporter BenE family transporter [Paraglaciecola sp.]|nr:benzoate/H(+) symporter BenE family transporter [Paraglaciecola sp.]NCT48391.1 benzoate/H(+) symporter BenE family transporter [Paraglaciecola sp.]
MAKPWLQDVSLSAISAGFIAVLVGFASAMAIVFQAAQAAGASQAMLISWVWALGLGMGIGCLGFSLYYRRPIIIAWSTPGAALLATSLVNSSIEQAIGIFIFVALLILFTGLSGMFDTLTKRLPLPIASAMLAGILVQFGLGIFTALQTSPWLVAGMLGVFVVAKRFVPRYAILLVLISGLLLAWQQQSLVIEALQWSFARPVWVTPEFSLSALIGIGIPLFIVTMTSQNIPGVATLKSSGYGAQPISPILSGTGIINLIFAPFGGFTFNLAAITAAICTSSEAHPDADKRYIAGVSTGFFNILAGMGAATVVSLFAAFPQPLIAALAGLALLGTIGQSLHSATEKPQYRDAAMITFLVTASGFSVAGIASAFWGLLLGVLSHLVLRQYRTTVA